MTNVDVVNDYFAALERRDFPAVEALLSDDLEFITPVESLDKQTFMRFITGLLDAFPDWRFDHKEIRVRESIASTTLTNVRNPHRDAAPSAPGTQASGSHGKARRASRAGLPLHDSGYKDRPD